MRYLVLLGAALLALPGPLPAAAEVSATVVGSVDLEAAPLDVELSADGRRLFVLVEGGKVLIYTAAGKLQETLEVDAATEDIALSPGGDLLYASSGDSKTVKVFRLEFVQRIAVEGSPVKGAAGAPVAIAVFNDFQ